jgi:hypothetical protein
MANRIRSRPRGAGFSPSTVYKDFFTHVRVASSREGRGFKSTSGASSSPVACSCPVGVASPREGAW